MRPKTTFLALLALPLALLAAPPAGAANGSVTASGMSFSPSTVTIQAGESVTWTNANGIHNVRADDSSFRCANGCDGAGGNGTPASGWSFTRTFNTAGTIHYHCEVHGAVGGFGMSGTVIVQAGQPSNPGVLRFSKTGYSLDEGGGQAAIVVQRTGGDDGATTVHYATGNGSATAPGDYTAESGTLTWGDHDSANKTFNVPVIDDATPENNETVNLTLSAATGASLGTPSSATLTIVDNDSAGSPGTLSFTTAQQSVGESAGDATVTVQRTGGSTGAVTVDYASSDGSATAGADYTAVAGSISFAAGDSANKTFIVPILDDSTIEPSETVNLTLANPTGGAALGSPGSQTLTILDDDVPMGPCVDDDFTLCLHGTRFQVTVDFRAPGDPAPRRAHRIPLTDRAGLFWFFNESNVEMLLKIQNACVDPFNRYWVFYAATTNVEFTVTVVDTDHQIAQFYSNDQGTAALPVQDTGAFDTCP